MGAVRSIKILALQRCDQGKHLWLYHLIPQVLNRSYMMTSIFVKIFQILQPVAKPHIFYEPRLIRRNLRSNNSYGFHHARR
jgi:hypothetical protein